MPLEWDGPCSRFAPRVVCRSRRQAMLDGEMYYDWRLGWIFPAEHRHWPRDMIARGTPPATWRSCPFCGGPLPDAEAAVDQLIGDGEE